MTTIEYFYSTHSAFAYIGAARLLDIAAAAGRRIVHRPIELAEAMAAAGVTAFRERTPAHRSYFFGREVSRWAEYRDVPIISHRPTYHDNDLALSSGLLIAAIEDGLNVDQLCYALMCAHWREDADLADAGTLAEVAQSVGFEPEPLLGKALTPHVQEIYAANTAEAITRSVFGSPTYFVDGDMFYGQDHLELVDRALHNPSGNSEG
ncbi:MAG: 2-hydroxychromene-2-carboxylate isomerase [Hyphomicrobiaceae bacterium]